MSVNREELKRMIDQIPEQDAAEVLDFIGYLYMKREREAALQLDDLYEDEDLIRQVQQSKADRQEGRVYNQQTGLEYLRLRTKELERGKDL